MSVVTRLHVVRAAPAEGEPPSRAVGDVGLTLVIFLIAALPLASVGAGIGRWDPASLGLGTVGVLLAGRELVGWLLGRRATRRRE